MNAGHGKHCHGKDLCSLSPGEILLRARPHDLVVSFILPEVTSSVPSFQCTPITLQACHNQVQLPIPQLQEAISRWILDKMWSF